MVTGPSLSRGSADDRESGTRWSRRAGRTRRRRSRPGRLPDSYFPSSRVDRLTQEHPGAAKSYILTNVPPDPPAVEPAPQSAAVNWRRNLAALWLAEFTAILGFSFAFPFLPLFLHRELHIPSGSQLAFWTGISAGVTGFALALTSPIWGRLADRYGRKPMLVRAMVGGGISVGFMGLAQSALQLTVLRGIQGASSGTVAAATALVATETPTEHLAWALGILNSAISLGSAAGPAAGGLAANFVGLRAIFVGGGVLLLLAMIPVLIAVRESPRRVIRELTPSTLQVLRVARPGTIRALVVLMVAQGLLQTSYGAAVHHRLHLRRGRHRHRPGRGYVFAPAAAE
ncbi:MAG: multidrug efflux MFS transporter [Chloroflexi bacterium]|nr:MAG: multidrug efflux MFS transporter [Chloroflexota bacterium]